MGQLMSGPDFKRFTLDVYGEPEVPAACLLLQDRFELDVNVLLFAAFLGAARARLPTPNGLDRMHRGVDRWHREVVRPLRAVRRRLKTGPAPAPDTDTIKLRSKIREVELQAELIELTQLDNLGSALDQIPTAGSAAENAAAALAVAVRAESARELDTHERNALTDIADAAARCAQVAE